MSHEGRNQHLRRPHFSKRLTKLAIFPDYKCPGMLCLALPARRKVQKLDFQSEFSADFLKVLSNSAQDNIISFLQRSDQSIDFSRVLRAFVASSAKLQLHLRLMRETFHFLLPNMGRYVLIL